MVKCCVCGNPVTNAEHGVLFWSTVTGEEMCVCEHCEKQLAVLTEGENPADVKRAVNYFYTYMNEVGNDEVKQYLREIVESNADAVEELVVREEKKKPVSERQRDYFAEREANAQASSGWISGLRIFAWIGFIAIIVSGMALSVPLFEHNGVGTGLLVILMAFVVAFLSTAGIMVFLDMAEDLKAIRAGLEKQGQKKK